jgi:hypothetical protein
VSENETEIETEIESVPPPPPVKDDPELVEYFHRNRQPPEGREILRRNERSEQD